MHIHIFAFGKWKQAPEQALFTHYVKRCRWKVELSELSSQTQSSVAMQQEYDTAMLLQKAKHWSAESCIALDETGEHMSSHQCASMFGQWQDSGVRRSAILIGGDTGLNKQQLIACDKVLSFGRMTWPHLLVRALLAEQLYRMQTILDGHPYHRA